ncbi:hypothetical protein ACUN9Y_03925 [Halomonas sp. V046]|uniref:hypothetical protein n=1 Tax=Halomonas sp. V046 TaxID=3459611 RepID=UPI0040443FB9
MNSQIIGVIAAEIAGNDDSELQIGAQVAGSATQYNYLPHNDQSTWIERASEEDPAKQFRLAAAACVEIHCSAEFPVDSGQSACYRGLEALGSRPRGAPC